MSAYKNVTHVIFDMDGLLLDTETIYSKVTQNILDEYGNGQIYTYAVKATLMGFQSAEVAKRIIGVYNLPLQPDEFTALTRTQAHLDLFREAQLLPDTEKTYENVIRDIAAEYGKPYPWEVRVRLMGTVENVTAKIAVTELGLPITIDEFRQKFSKESRGRLGNVQMMKGAARFIRHLNKHNIPFALATSSSLEMATIKMTNHHELFDLFNHKVMGSSDPDVVNGKPAPDIFLVAAKRFPDNPKPENCLVFEDAPNGVRAASLAGMQSVMVPDPQVAPELRTEATLVLNSLLDLKPELFGLPPFDDSPVNSESDDSADK